MMNLNLREDYIGNSQLQRCGILSRVLHTLIGMSACKLSCYVKEQKADGPRIYYMYANMASLNAWRRERHFSRLFALKGVYEADMDTQIHSFSDLTVARLVIQIIFPQLSSLLTLFHMVFSSGKYLPYNICSTSNKSD